MDGKKVYLDGDVPSRAASLLDEVLAEYRPGIGMGSMSCNVYDSAWVACVSRDIDGIPHCLFPSTVQYVLESQDHSGRFATHASAGEKTEFSRSDDILATLAALFMMKKVGGYQTLIHGVDVSQRISRAAQWLTVEMATLQLDESMGVGFEILLPALLELLEGYGLDFEFPAKSELYAIRGRKLGNLKPETLYGPTPSAMIHSLEAFYGRQDFNYDMVKHHKVQGSMMNSPSATAAYLMRCSEWDEEANAYLKLVVLNGAGQGSGGVPSAFPSTNFEMLWVTSTLLHAGLSPQIIGYDRCEKVLAIIESNEGLVGFAAGIEADLDDSSRASMLRHFLRRPGSTPRITKAFSRETHFATYQGERNPSLSANSNALIALLLDEPYDDESILIIARYLCDSCWHSRELPQDKWNISPWYTTMLVSQALTLLLQVWENGHLSRVPEPFLQDRVVLCLFKLLLRVLQGQQHDGDWNQSVESTAYCVLTLADVSCLPMATFLRQEIESAIDRGRRFMQTTSSSSSSMSEEYLWIEKVNYGSPFLRRAYVLAAMFASANERSLGAKVEQLCNIPYVEDWAILYPLRSCDKHDCSENGECNCDTEKLIPVGI